MNKLFLLIVFLVFGSFLSCDEDPVNSTNDYSLELANLSENVILRTYDDLKRNTSGLAAWLSVWEGNQHAESAFTSAQEAWKTARRSWEFSQGFLYGPVDQLGIDLAVDSWPVNETDLNEVLNSGQDLTKSYIDALDGTLKGFHTIEYLLWGSDGNKQFSDFTPRELDYLQAAGRSLFDAAVQLYNSWDPAEENYISNFKKAGVSGESIYPSQKSALQEIVNGMIVIADEVANEKINDPFIQQDLTLEESRFSANSKADFADNIRSIQNIYLGTLGNGAWLGISAIVQRKDAALDEEVKTAISNAITAIESIEGTFTSAIFNSPQSVTNAQDKVRELQLLLESEVLPLITSL